MERVVITGIGLVTPNGIGTEETWRSVLAAESGIGPITLFDATEFSTRIAGEVKGFQAERWMPKKKIKEMGRFAQLSIAASQLCMEDAAIELTEADRDMCGTFIGVGIGGLEFLYAHSVTLREKGPSKVSPYLIPQVIANLAAGQVAMSLNLRGPSYCVTSACSSSGHSLGEAFEWIRRGRTAIMLTGGAESTVTGLGIGGFGAMFALSRRNDDPAHASRPWDKGRDGFVCSEGAGSLLLESLPHAKARGAKIYGEVVGYGASCDAYHITKPSPNGEGAYRAMRMALEDASLDPDQIDYVNAHGTSTPQGDIEESRAIIRMFGEHALSKKLWVSSTKSVMGHLLGGAGAVEAALCALALRDGRVPPTANLVDQDPECPLDFVPLVARERRVTHVMSNSFGFGGTNVSLVLSRFTG
jgi:3-oxoacyl-[acyl-carrier-protein] synthase II